MRSPPTLTTPFQIALPKARRPLTPSRSLRLMRCLLRKAASQPSATTRRRQRFLHKIQTLMAALRLLATPLRSRRAVPALMHSGHQHSQARRLMPLDRPHRLAYRIRSPICCRWAAVGVTRLRRLRRKILIQIQIFLYRYAVVTLVLRRV